VAEGELKNDMKSGKEACPALSWISGVFQEREGIVLPRLFLPYFFVAMTKK
jgi:hypothetical protein